MKYVPILFALLAIGCADNNDDMGPVRPKARDDYLVQLTCDKDTPDYVDPRKSFESVAFFIGHPLLNGEPVSKDDLNFEYLGDFYYKADGAWARCNNSTEDRPVRFWFEEYVSILCQHPDAAPVELIVWVPASMDGPESIDPALGCKPTVEAPK